MCGICGFAPKQTVYTPSKQLIVQMCAPLRHRGPDDTGVYTAEGIGLGHQRLKIIDLVSGQQPMLDASGRYALVFNGEVYNYQELKQELASKGYTFTSRSDTEVLLHGLIDQGIDFLNKINGMFAFGFWDSKEQSLLLARDRFGVKPLYYSHENNDGIYFSSEASSIACVSKELSTICQESTSLYLALSYIPHENSIFQKIKRLEPGTFIKVSHGRIVQQQKWWDTLAEWQESLTQKHTVQQWHELFSQQLEEAVKIRLKADVPLGVFLSSGIDSAVIAALAVKNLPQTATFTMAFEDASYNEAPFARETAQALGTKHHEVMANLGSVEQLLEVAATLDEPFADTSIIPTQALCGLAKQHITVALSGDGGDELLGGYITHKANDLYKKLFYLPAFVIKTLRTLIFQLPDNHRKINTIFKLKQFLAAYPREEQLAHACWRLLIYPEDMKKIFPQLEPLPDVFRFFQKAWDESNGLPILDRFLYVDYQTWFTHDILFKSDRASMHKSLELRSPFIDYKLFRLCAGMPSELKRKHNKGKMALRHLAQDILPASCLQRPKLGFNAPVSLWLTHEWREVSEESFSKQSLEGLGLQSSHIMDMWEKHKQGRHNYGMQLFNVLILALWHKNLYKG